MKQAVTTGIGEISFRELNAPSIGSSQVLLDMQYVGICGSDIHILHGVHPAVPPSSFPLVQGHEGVGKIVKLGAEVRNFSVGDVVVIEPQISCGTCYQCAKGDSHICQSLKIMGLHCDGMFSEQLAVESTKIHNIHHLPIPSAAMIEPLACAVRAVRRVDSIISKNVVVLGAGPIGNLVAQVAKAYGAHKVAIVDVLQERLNLAKKLGSIDYTWNSRADSSEDTKDNIQDKIREVYGEQGADVIFECVGIEQTLESAIQLSGRGMEIIVVGVFGNTTTISAAAIQNKEISIRGTRIYKREDYIGAIDLVRRKLVDLDSLIYKVIPFEEYPHAYQLIEENKEQALKVLVKINGADSQSSL